MADSCWSCRFFRADDVVDSNALGECHRRAPVLNQHPQRPDYRWPVTRRDDWCGEFVSVDDPLDVDVDDDALNAI